MPTPDGSVSGAERPAGAEAADRLGRAHSPGEWSADGPRDRRAGAHRHPGSQGDGRPRRAGHVRPLPGPRGRAAGGFHRAARGRAPAGAHHRRVAAGRGGAGRGRHHRLLRGRAGGQDPGLRGSPHDARRGGPGCPRPVRHRGRSGGASDAGFPWDAPRTRPPGGLGRLQCHAGHLHPGGHDGLRPGRRHLASRARRGGLRFGPRHLRGRPALRRGPAALPRRARPAGPLRRGPRLHPAAGPARAPARAVGLHDLRGCLHPHRGHARRPRAAHHPGPAGRQCRDGRAGRGRVCPHQRRPGLPAAAAHDGHRAEPEPAGGVPLSHRLGLDPGCLGCAPGRTADGGHGRHPGCLALHASRGRTPARPRRHASGSRRHAGRTG